MTDTEKTAYRATTQPLRICSGITKGGAGKSTLALNLAQYFGDRGHRVLLIDMNPQSDSANSVERALDMGKQVKFYVTRNPGFDASKVPDDEGLRNYDVIIVDTVQHMDYLQEASPSDNASAKSLTRTAWTHCELLAAPINENRMDFDLYSRGFRAFAAMNAERPILAVPMLVKPMKNSRLGKAFVSYLETLRELGVFPCPYNHSMLPDNNLTVSNQETRIYECHIEPNQSREEMDQGIGPITANYWDKWIGIAKWVEMMAHARYPEFAGDDKKRGGLDARDQARN